MAIRLVAPITATPGKGSQLAQAYRARALDTHAIALRQIGGCGCCTGRGRTAGSRTEKNFPSYTNGSSVQARF